MTAPTSWHKIYFISWQTRKVGNMLITPGLDYFVLPAFSSLSPIAYCGKHTHTHNFDHFSPLTPTSKWFYLHRYMPRVNKRTSNNCNRPRSAKIHPDHLSPCPSKHASLPPIFSAPVPFWITQLPPSLASLVQTQTWHRCGPVLSSSCDAHQEFRDV